MSFKKVVGLALGTLFLLAGCTNPNMLYIETRPDIHPDPSKATLVIYRTLSYCGPTRVHNFIDKTYIGTTQGKCFFVAKVDPGSHYVIAVAENKACAKANFELGKVYYLQQGMFTGVIRARVVFTGSNQKDFGEQIKDTGIKYTAINPNEKAPTLDDGDYRKVVANFEDEEKKDPSQHKDTDTLQGY